jgi:hypothetical protein
MGKHVIPGLTSSEPLAGDVHPLRAASIAEVDTATPHSPRHQVYDGRRRIQLVYAAGPSYLLMCAVLFAPGILVYMQARRERGQPAFVGFEWRSQFSSHCLPFLQVI